jgi:hypothetical protein
MMPPNEIAAWASAYVEAQMLQDIPGDHPLWWAIERFMLVDTSTLPEDCWAAILEILSRNPPRRRSLVCLLLVRLKTSSVATGLRSSSASKPNRAAIRYSVTC